MLPVLWLASLFVAGTTTDVVLFFPHVPTVPGDHKAVDPAVADIPAVDIEVFSYIVCLCICKKRSGENKKSFCHFPL
jgi:hypothetical protein